MAIRKSGVREDLRADLWKREESRIRKLFQEGNRQIAMATVDLDHNGVKEIVVRYDFIPCDEEAGSMFGVMDPDTKRLDWRFRQMLLGPNASESAEIMLYDGRAFLWMGPKLETNGYLGGLWNRGWCEYNEKRAPQCVHVQIPQRGQK